MSCGTGIGCPIARQAQNQPNTPAVFTEHHQLTYAQLHARVAQTAGFLRDLNLSAGKRIALLGDNSLPYLILIFALRRLGISSVPLNLRWPKDLLRRCVAKADVGLILYQRKYDRLISSLDCPTLEVSEIPSDGGAVREISSTRPEDSEEIVVFTSGTTGDPKAVRLTRGNFYYSALGSNQVLPLAAGDSWLASLPFYHVGGLALLHRSFWAGAAVTIVPSPKSWRSFPTHLPVTHISVVPAQIEAWLARGDVAALQQLKLIVMGGAPASEDLLREIIRLKLPLVTTYGLTEAASMVTCVEPGSDPAKLFTAGKVLPFRELAVVDKNGTPVPAGISGEIVIRGKVVTPGYLEMPCRDSQQWWPTGDVGFLDEAGYLTVLTRADHLIISGGENIDPGVIEKAACRFPGVKKAVVLPVADSRWGQRPALFIQSDHSDAFPLDSLRKFLQKNLSKLYMPDRIIILEKLPETAIGKIDVSELKHLL